MKFKRKNILAKKLLFLDGLSGSGKSLITPILTSLNNSEFYLYDHLFDEILILLENKKISFNGAQSLLKTHADMNMYNIMLGRNVNFRATDHSGVYYGMLKNKFDKRLNLKDGKQIIKSIYKDGKWLPIITHYVLPYFKNLKKIFNDRKLLFVSVARDPIYLINSFNKNDWEKKIISNPKDLTLTYIDKFSKFNPWYFKGINQNMSFIEKYAEYVLKYFYFQKNFEKKNHHIIYYENFVKDPKRELSKLYKIIGYETIITKKLLKKFELPRKIKKSDTNKIILPDVINNNNKLKKKIINTYENYLKNID